MPTSGTVAQPASATPFHNDPHGECKITTFFFYGKIL